MLRRILPVGTLAAVALCLLPATPLAAQSYQRIWGYCAQLGTSPLAISTSCTVNIYNTGTMVNATVYSDAIGTPLSLPTTANSQGVWAFYYNASANQNYDVRLSGGVPALVPYTLPLAAFLDVGGGGGGGVCGSNGQIQYNNSSSCGGMSGSAVTAATGALTLTASADNVVPITVLGHSGTQSVPLAIYNLGSSASCVGLVVECGEGIGSFTSLAFPSLHNFQQNDDSSWGWTMQNMSNSRTTDVGAFIENGGDFFLTQFDGAGELILGPDGNRITSFNGSGAEASLLGDGSTWLGVLPDASHGYLFVNETGPAGHLIVQIGASGNEGNVRLNDTAHPGTGPILEPVGTTFGADAAVGIPSRFASQITVETQANFTSGHIPKADVTSTSYLTDGYAAQGTDTSLLTSGTISGSTGVTLCTDASHGATTSGCSASIVSSSITCGVLSGASPQACASTAASPLKIVYGQGQLVSASPSTVTINSISPAFATTTSFYCTVTNATTAADALKVTNTSTSSITVTGPNTVTDNFSFICIGT